MRPASIDAAQPAHWPRLLEAPGSLDHGLALSGEPAGRGLSHLCFPTQAHDFLDGFGPQFDVVGGNHDLEGIDEFFTDESNLEVYLRELGKKTPQFCHEVADKTLVVGLGSTKFRSAQYTSHEVVVDDE